MVLSAGIIPVRRDNQKWNFLFLRAYRNWDFPKGIVEEGEDPLETAKRELREETSITDPCFRWGRIYCETAPYSGGKKVARYYIAETNTSDVVFFTNPEIGKPEHHEYRWVPYKELKKLSPARLEGVIEWANEIVGDTPP
ncbi:MAG: NUDIX domain-containing protein [Desulfatiglandaceae bacterium]